MIAENVTDNGCEDSKLLTAGDLARQLRISLRQVYRLDKSGSLPASLKIGQCVRWDPVEIDRWVKCGAPCRAEWEKQRDADGLALVACADCHGAAIDTRTARPIPALWYGRKKLLIADIL